MPSARGELRQLKIHEVLTEVEYHRLSYKYGNVFTAETGAEALERIISDMDLERMRDQLEKDVEEASPAVRKKMLARLKLVKSLLKAHIRPDWMFLAHE